MAVPKRKVSHSRKKMRSLATINKIKNSFYNYSICPSCSFIKKKHHVCTYCGYFKENVRIQDVI